MKKLIQKSAASFAGRIEDPFQREYLFVLEGAESGRIAGTSMLIAQHGHHDAPHIYFDVLRDERYSGTLDRHFSHLCLRLGFLYKGPTEIGGLVLDPELRSLGLGKQLSFVRFLFIAMYRRRFRPWVIAELMPPLLEDGRSELWEYLGRNFTGLDYQEADKLSQRNKEFITSLFPQSPLYVSLLPKHVQDLIGQVGDETKGVRRMLENIGFEYSERIDPFDGGPHFEAQCEDISLVQNARLCMVARDALKDEAAPEEDRVRAMVGVGQPEGPTGFRARMDSVVFDGANIRVTQTTKKLLRLSAGQTVWAVAI
jgi:arginine N-succinyltransferase